MGGKRSDQHKTDSAEGSSSDQKRRQPRDDDARAADERARGQSADADDDRVDEASRESFPASDPPAIP
jgi:hypothetical protein